MVLGWLVYFSIAFNIGWEILSAKVTVPLNSGIARLSTALEKNLLGISIAFTSSLTI